MEALSMSPWRAGTYIQFGRYGRARASRVLMAIVVLAIALRLLYSFGYQRGLRHVAPEDEITDNYHRIAENMYQGAGYRELPEHPPTVRRPPAYPLFLYASFRVFGLDYRPVQVLQALLGGLASWILYRLGRRVASVELGLVAAILFAFYPPAVEYSAMLYAENLYFPLFLAFAFFLAVAVEESSPLHGMLAGVFWGLGLLTRGTMLAFPLALPVILALSPTQRRKWKRWPRWAVPALITGLLVLSPWTARNYHLTGKMIPVSSWGWAPFYHGIQVSKQMLHWGDLRSVDANANKMRHDILVERLYKGDRAKAWTSTREMVRHEEVARDLVLAEIRRDPAGWLGRGFVGVVFTWFQTLGAGKRVLSLAIHLPLMVLFVIGTVGLFRRDPAGLARAFPIFAVIAFVNIFQGFVFPFIRYMAPAIALSLIVAARPIVSTLRGRGFEAHDPDPGI